MRWGYAVLLAGVLLLCGDLLVHDRLLYYRDVQRLFVPLRALVAAEIQAGRLPLWNPHQWLGVPLWGDPQAAVLYPPNLLFTLLPMEAAWRASTLLHQFLAAAFAAGFFRRAWRFGVPAAVLGGATYGLGSTLASCTSLPNMHAAAAWLPLALWACVVADRSNRIRGWVILGIVLGVQMLAGSAEVCLLTWLACGLHVLLVPAPERAALRIRGAAVALAVAAGLAAAQILPAYELAVRSARPHIGFAEATSYSLHPLSWLGLLVPGLWGSTLDGTHWGGFLVLSPSGDGLPLFDRVYAGFLPWLLAVVALRRSGWPRAFTLVLLGVCSTIALGRHTPAAALVYRVLPLPLRYPEKAMLGVAFAFACLAAGGLEALRAPGRARSWAVPASLLFVIGCFMAGASHFAGTSFYRAAMWVAQRSNVNPHWTAPRAADFPDLTIPGLTLAAGVAISAIVLAARSSRWRPHVAVGWLLAVGILDLVVAGRAAIWTTPASLYERRSPLVAELEHTISGAGRVLHEPGAEPPSGLAYPVRSRVEQDAWWSQDIARTNTGAPLGILYADGYGPANLFAVARIPLAAWPGLGLAWVIRSEGGRHISDTVAPDVEGRWTELGVELARVDAPRPRAYWTDRVRSLSTADSALALIRSGRANPRSITLLEPPQTKGFDFTAFLARLPETPNAGPGDASISIDVKPARVVEDTHSSLVIEVDAPGRGFLVVNDSAYPGWRARVDGRRAPLLRANAVVRVVPVEGGRHHVVLEYRPLSVLVGVAVSVATILLAVVLCGPWRRARPAP
jgi:hypothetical protein